MGEKIAEAWQIVIEGPGKSGRGKSGFYCRRNQQCSYDATLAADPFLDLRVALLYAIAVDKNSLELTRDGHAGKLQS